MAVAKNCSDNNGHDSANQAEGNIPGPATTDSPKVYR